MKIHVAARNEDFAQQFSKNNPNAVDVVLHRGAKSLFTLLQGIIDSEEDYALFVHDDVFMPSSVNSYISKLVETLNTEWPNWGICGNAGIVAPTLTAGSRVCRYLFDPHGGPSLGGHVLPAETVDGNTILINCRALRQANVQLPIFEGFQFYDISLSVETLAAGRAVLIAPDLACFHNSKGNQSEFDRAFGSKALIDYLSNKLSNRLLYSLNGVLKLPFLGKKPTQFDICNKAVENASIGRPKAKIAFVIRSQFRNRPLLTRAINSTLAFAAATNNKSIKTYVVTEDAGNDYIKELPEVVSVIAASITETVDTRHLLIREAINSIDEDFVLFLDDDDWVFPNEADYISDLLSCLPITSHLVVESQHFAEAIKVPGETDWRNSSLVAERRFASADWPLNFTGSNYVPMCGIFYSRTILLQQPSETYGKITYYEDYTVSLFAMLNPESIFFSIPKLVSGISIRDAQNGLENTVNVKNRIKWNQSQAELAHYICANTSSNIAFSIGESFGVYSKERSIDRNEANKNYDLNWTDRKSIAISRLIMGLFAFIFHPRHYKTNISGLLSATKSGGIRGFVRSIADMRQLFGR
ncbi:hypothetical protein LQT97_02070 [Brucella pseudogrignonensis]|uniref:hypothetical protein n=1 Tax=Brucella pseudogrignonensis TaxID=419475 RepID=UPI001E46AACA|nr:hypothetical protein [Brucella pseudogrignonensis]MCD4510013.1 hypothetical protein [Brucella pseudogrignonensis]